ncbi:CRISPR-associated helicase Cas3/CRISPR-associated endonuclease Cas3-HD [Candidatus Sulfopaludibacter sp. SbA4]|nr:CRISPR-associated helicase Cas3/CRISPR-associated endonuclease Cas3-HD [Candidatus Sulfopaludibacter sp. SbA4]
MARICVACEVFCFLYDEVMPTYYAHSENERGDWNPLRLHLGGVAERARGFAEAFGAGEGAFLGGLLHDLGKYGDLFQERLKGREKGLDHWSIGASVCLERYRSSEIAMAIQGHHLGLQWWDRDELRKLLPLELEGNVPGGRRLTGDRGVLLDRFRADGLTLPEGVARTPPDAKSAAAMLDLRMLFSALTDADYLATEEHFDEAAARMREPAAELRPGVAAEVLDRYLQVLAAGTDSSSAVAGLRHDLLEACRAAATGAPGLFTLTAPTGAGKTLSTLAFALRHAEENALRRLVVVMPFLSIIDQTARVYREALAEMGDGERYFLEHHSLAIEAVDGEGQDARLRGMLAQNWDAPVIITTSVQFFESLFSNSPAACRKLHRLAGSVIVFDEVQTLPLKVVLPTLATLSHLAARYRSSVVFSTATQPAFRHLDEQVRRYCTNGWQPRELAPEELRLFERARRVRVEWPQRGERVGWGELAAQFEGLSQVLCIVNLKRHARDLFHVLKPQWGEDVFHLSTAMCPKHRGVVLAGVRKRLEEGKRCALVATQCVEAGVDLDFPAAFRALGPLDAVAQAAGRCNRNGKLETGVLRVFRPEDEGYPAGVYQQAADLTGVLLNREEGISIDDPAAFEEYFRMLYGITKLEDRELREAVLTKHFPNVREHYRIIEQDSVNAVVTYDRERYEELAEEAGRKRLSRGWVMRARPYAVSCFRREVAGAMVAPVLLKDGAESSDWFLYLFDKHYDPGTGLCIPKELEYLEA